jgi:hypothetical protein
MLTPLKLTQVARDANKRRRIRHTEIKEFCSAGLMVFTGLLLAVVYGLLTHQIHN